MSASDKTRATSFLGHSSSLREEGARPVRGGDGHRWTSSAAPSQTSYCSNHNLEPQQTARASRAALTAGQAAVPPRQVNLSTSHFLGL